MIYFLNSFFCRKFNTRTFHFQVVAINRPAYQAILELEYQYFAFPEKDFLSQPVDKGISE